MEELESRLEAGLEKFGVPGASIGLLRGDDEIFVSRGVTSVEAPVPVDENTLFQIGSTTKTLTATLAMRLVEDGRLDLDAPVRPLVPELRLADADALERISMRDLLTHMGGHDGDLFDDFGSGDDALSRACAAMATLPQLAPLRTVWSYSNAGFQIAGRVIEVVTGRTFEQAAEAIVLEPLGMTRSFFTAGQCISYPTAVGHRCVDGVPRVTRPWGMPRAVAPAGGLVASMRDQLAYARFHLGDGRAADGSRILSAESMQLMQSPLVTAGGGRAAAVGLAWLLQATPGLIAHGGETNGQSSSFALVPSMSFAIAVSTNADTGAAVHSSIVKWALREFCPLPRPTADPTPADATSLPAHVGRFVSVLEELHVSTAGDGSLQIQLRPTATSLRVFPDLRATPIAPLEVFSGGALKVTGGPLAGARGEFLKDRSGEIRWLRMLGRIHVREDSAHGSA